jgi:hypothetical protein
MGCNDRKVIGAETFAGGELESTEIGEGTCYEHIVPTGHHSFPDAPPTKRLMVPLNVLNDKFSDSSILLFYVGSISVGFLPCKILKKWTPFTSKP